MKFFDRLLGHEAAEPEPDRGGTMQADTQELLEKHRETLEAVGRVLADSHNDSRKRIAEAIDDTGAAIETLHRPRRRRRMFS